MPVYNADYIETVQHKSLATDLEKLGIFGKRRKLVGSINAYRKYLAAHDLHQALIEEEKHYQVKAKKTIDPKSIMCLQDEIEMSLLKLGKKANSLEDFRLLNALSHEGILPAKPSSFIVANAMYPSEHHIPKLKQLITESSLDANDFKKIIRSLDEHYTHDESAREFSSWLKAFQTAKDELSLLESIKARPITSKNHKI